MKLQPPHQSRPMQTLRTSTNNKNNAALPEDNDSTFNVLACCETSELVVIGKLRTAQNPRQTFMLSFRIVSDQAIKATKHSIGPLTKSPKAPYWSQSGR
mmetsp:Transcript_80168/g.166849  ORF Transcript_80168/g.166849 Transcript_80168/m.166849 type:complete len:99 (-) Transcript_80168:1121-1417(-)